MMARRVSLIGPTRQDDLGLQYLAAAAEKAGHEARLSTFAARDDLARVLIEVATYQPHVVGLGMAFQYAIDDFCLLARVLRRQGYQGHITCGGHVPTYSYDELLRSHPAIDSCVRHEGEATLTELLDALARGESLSGIRGLVHRDGSRIVVEPTRPPQADLDSLPWPKRDSLREAFAGVPIASLITARGALGPSEGELPHRLRDPQKVADEIAHLYGRGVRFFFIQDDSFVLPNEGRTLERIRAITEAMRARGVRNAAFAINGRPEDITAPVLQAAREMGVLHLALGIENASAKRLADLGRTHRPEDSARALELCRTQGIEASFDLMLFDPDCTLDDVRQNLDFAESTAHLAWNVRRAEIYAGTGLLERLRTTHRLRGDYRGYGYDMRDPRAELMLRILRVCFHERAFAFDSLLYRLVRLSLAAKISERFFPSSDTLALVNQVRTFSLEVHRDSVSILRRSLDFARTVDLDDASCTHRYEIDLGLELRRRDLPWHSLSVRLWEQLHALRTEPMRE